jgi:hypothetical protein
VQKVVLARVIALVGRSPIACWFPHTTRRALYFCRSLCLSSLYLNTYMHPSICCPFVFVRSISLKVCIRSCSAMCRRCASLNWFQNRCFSSSRRLVGLGRRLLLWTLKYRLALNTPSYLVATLYCLKSSSLCGSSSAISHDWLASLAPLASVSLAATPLGLALLASVSLASLPRIRRLAKLAC